MDIGQPITIHRVLLGDTNTVNLEARYDQLGRLSGNHNFLILVRIVPPISHHRQISHKRLESISRSILKYRVG